MTVSRKIIAGIALIGIGYSLFRLTESSTGGGSFENAIKGIIYTVFAVFIASFISLIIYRKSLNERKDEMLMFAFASIIIILIFLDSIHAISF